MHVGGIFRWLLSIWIVAIAASTCGEATETQVTWNPSDKGANVVLSNGNLNAAGNGNVFNMVRAAVGYSSGKRCFELAYVASVSGSASILAGMANASASLSTYPGNSSTSFGVQWLGTTTEPFVNGVARNSFVVPSTAVTNDVITICADLGVGSAWVARNGVWATGNPATGVSPTVTGMTGTWLPAAGTYNAANVFQLRSLAAEIAYMPSGFISWAEGAPPPPPSGWQPTAQIYTRTGNPSSLAFFLNTYTGVVIPGTCTPSTWCAIDLTSIDSHVASAQSAFVTGIMIITPGSTAQTCDFHIAVRGPGDAMDPGNYQMQTAVIAPNQTARSGASTWVPLVNGKFELYYWYTPAAGTYPTYCSYGISLLVQAFTGPTSLPPQTLLAGPSTVLAAPPKRKKAAVQGWCKSTFGALCPQ